MLRRLTIRQRILTTFIAIVIVGTVVPLIVGGSLIQQMTLEFHQHHVETDALSVAVTFVEPLERYLEGEGTTGMQRLLVAIQQEIGHDYIIVDRVFSVVGYTENADVTPNQRLVTPELLGSQANRIGADVRAGPNGMDWLYLAVPVQYERETIGYIVVSEPMEPAYQEVRQRWLELVTGTLPVIVAVIAASLWISGTISRPIQHLRDSALKMAGGAFDTRIEGESQDEVGQLAQAFNHLAHQVENLLNAQRSFVSNAAHELRTPLMTIKLRISALDDEMLSADERTAYQTEIQQEIDHMAELVSSLLVLARIDEGRHTQQEPASDPVSALHDLARNWRIEAAKRGLRLESEIAPNLPELPISQNDLRLVLDNLLDNAVKYTASGTVRLRAMREPYDVVIQVEDSGIGFTPEQGEHLFDRFFRSEDVRGKHPGNGLGLSIVKAVLDQYGGRIVAHSAGPDQGTVFTLHIPFARSSAGAVSVLTPAPT
ncbi:MAG: HAMP domain-containing protein [Chloroflexi bacterium]|nr:HAMP domain-containing protein [Chloroflexota bacterium]